VYDLLDDPPASDARNLDLKGIRYHLPVYLVGRPFQ
jgi:adenylate cyclase